MWKRLGTAVAVGTLFAASLGGAAVATTDEAPPTNPPPGVEDTHDEDGWQLSPEEVTEINAETDALVEYLTGLGYEVTVQTDDEGFRYPVFDEENEEILEATNTFYEQMFRDEVAAWSDAEKAEWNADIDAFIADLAAQGITASKVEIAPGVYDVDWTDELEAGIDESNEGFPNDEFGGEPSAQDVAEINADTDALVEYLEGLGFDVDVETDEYGIRYPALDDDPDSAVYEAINDCYEAMFADEVADWSDAEKAEWNASIDEMVAEFEAEGVTPETFEIAPGVYDIDWTDELDFPETGKLLEEDAA